MNARDLADRVEVRDDKAMLTRNGQLIQISGKFPRLAADAPGGRLRELLALLRAF